MRAATIHITVAPTIALIPRSNVGSAGGWCNCLFGLRWHTACRLKIEIGQLAEILIYGDGRKHAAITRCHGPSKCWAARQYRRRTFFPGPAGKFCKCDGSSYFAPMNSKEKTLRD